MEYIKNCDDTAIFVIHLREVLKKKGMYFFHFLYKKEKKIHFMCWRENYIYIFFTNPPKIMKLITTVKTELILQMKQVLFPSMNHLRPAKIVSTSEFPNSLLFKPWVSEQKVKNQVLSRLVVATDGQHV